MKKSQILTIGLIACLVLLAAGAWIIFGGSAGFRFANADKYTSGDTTVSAEAEELEISWTAGKVRVEYYDGGEIRVSETARRALNDDEKLQWWLDGKTLRIQFCKPGFRLGSMPEKELTVSLPKGLELKKAKIVVTSGDVDVADLKAKELQLESTSGNITATAETEKLTGGSTSGDCRVTLGNADEVKLSATSGNIALLLGEADKVEIGSTSGTLSVEGKKIRKTKISATSGTVYAKLAAFDELEIGTTSGNVTAALPEKPGFSCEVSSTSGSFDSGIATEKDGKTYSCGDGSAKCRIGTTSGDVRIDRAE